MTIRVGTIVTPYDPGDPNDADTAGKTCEGYWKPKTDVRDVCIGIVLEAEDIDIPVQWLTTCKEHNTPPTVQIMPLEELWEIGQVD